MQIVFNLSPVTDTIYFPTAWLVQTDRDGALTYIAHRATTVTCPSFGFDITPPLQQLLTLTDQLTTKAIEQKFKPPKSKSTPSFAALLADRDTKTTVEGYISRQLDQFLNLVLTGGYALTLDGERKTLLKDVLILPIQEPLIPHLSFNKTKEGVEYKLQLGTEQEKWPVSSRNVIPLTNTDPAWLMVDYALFKTPGINGNMIRPFQKKDVVQIPPDKVKLYFRQFIAKSAGRTHIEAEGFEVRIANVLQKTRLEAIENILEKHWQIKPVFEYEGAEFLWGEKQDNITAVLFNDDSEDITVKRISRDKATEKKRIDQLFSSGLFENGRFFSTSADRQATLDEIIEWLSQFDPGTDFTLVSPEVDGKKVALLTGQVQIQTTLENDWFDVRGKVVVGKYTFPFAALIKNLRTGDRLFPLGDGTWFYIPDTWFARYADIAENAKLSPDGEGLHLPKALFTLLQDSDELAEPVNAQLPVIDPDTIDYHPPATLNATLRPYQLFGVKWLIGHYHHRFGACLADDMGLGKTLQTIAALLYMKEQRKTSVPTIEPQGQIDLFQTWREELSPLTALVILPASLVFNWQRELQRFAPSLMTQIHLGPKRSKDARALSGFDVVLTTYQTARIDLEFLSRIDWHCIVLDESQQIKNRSSEVSKVVRSLSATNKISLSGTPIENALSDLWAQMEFINPATLGSYAAFRDQFEIPISKHNDAQAKKKLFDRVKPFFLRRTKEEVAPDLPALDEQVFLSEMSTEQRRRYDEVKSAMRNQILSLFDDPKTRLLAIQALTRLRQLANHPLLTDQEYEGDSGKMDDVLAYWQTLKLAGHKVLFFSSFEQHLQLYKKYFDAQGIPYSWLTGDIATKDRAAVIEGFQQNEHIQAFFCTLGAGGVGLNLTAADYVFLLDPWWNPAREAQAIARAHRIGQTRPVTVIRFISRDTIEEKIRVMQARKTALGQALFDGDDQTDWSRDEILEMLD